MNNYFDLEVWKSSRKLALFIHEITKGFPQEEIFGIVDQMRECAVAIPSYIAEGFGSGKDKETSHFLVLARGSVFELETLMFLASDQRYLSEDSLRNGMSMIADCKKMLNTLIAEYEQKLLFSAISRQ